MLFLPTAKDIDDLTIWTDDPAWESADTGAETTPERAVVITSAGTASGNWSASGRFLKTP